jgi:hypothetical protein
MAQFEGAAKQGKRPTGARARALSGARTIGRRRMKKPWCQKAPGWRCSRTDRLVNLRQFNDTTPRGERQPGWVRRVGTALAGPAVPQAAPKRILVSRPPRTSAQPHGPFQSRYPLATSVNSNTNIAPHSRHTSRSSAVMYTSVQSHRAHATVGSVASGGGSGAATPPAVLPMSRVTGWKVVPQPAHTWLKQQFGVHE